MKNILTILCLLFCFGVAEAQLIKEKAPADPKYLSGAVPVVNGKVTFSKEIDIKSSLSTEELYNQMTRWVGKYYNNESVLRRLDIDSNTDNRHIEVGIVQYIVFKNTLFVFDRTQIIYHLSLDFNGQKMTVKMFDISYFYEEERSPEKITAEDQITDENALNKKKNKLLPKTGKFRAKTIDLFENICLEASLFANSL